MLAYVVEDNGDMNDLECLMLKSINFDVMPLYCAADLECAVKKKVPDIILLDIMLPDSDGITLVSQMRSNSRMKNTPIILVSAKDGHIEKVRGLDAGADDYITKPFNTMEYISRVKALVRRTKQERIPENILKAGNIEIDESKREVYYCGRNIVLTYKEYELLRYLVLNKGLVLSRDKIMENVWGFDFQGESRTVDMHIKTLRHKIGRDTGIIKTVRNVGYKLNC